ncbi:MAG TPA: methyltransferase [Bryobacteraceae bacterium]|nr:methyltransferase [Bryobacteraceae bacterium]
MTEHHLRLETPEQAACFREAFTRAGYDEEGLVATLGPIQLPNRLGRERGHYRHLTGRGRPLDTLIRLFLLGIPEDMNTARRALAPAALEQWERAGLVESDGAQVRGSVRVMAFQHLLLACDWIETPGAGTRTDLVMGITASTTTLADFTIRRPVQVALDMGTGGGAQAFRTASHSTRVLAVDRSARAVEFARFNAAFNSTGSNIEFIEGDGFAPVTGNHFDLIVSNPPFAVTPSSRFIYRDSGVAGDAFARRLLERAAHALNEGGFCQIVCDWAHIEGQPWQDRLAGWFAQTGCDAWAMRTDTHDAADYAHVWIRDTEHASAEESERLYDEWLAYYQRERIEAISTGLIAIRKASGRANWVRIEDGPDSNSGPFGEYVLRGFGLRDYLEATSDDAALMGARLRVAESVRVDHVCVWEEASWRIRSAKIRLAEGLQYEGNLDLRLAGMVAMCDGTRSVREVMAAMAQAAGADFDRIAPNCLALTRQLIERGFLLPA